MFDGTKAEPYVEWDAPEPAVGLRPVEARRASASSGPDDTIVRTSWVCGRHGANMVKTILRLAAEPEPLRFVDDQRGHPTFADDLAAMVARLVVRATGRACSTSPTRARCSWFEFAAGGAGRGRADDPGRVEPIATADLDPPRPAPRPANSVLDNAALRLSGIDLLDHYEAPLSRLVAHLRS